MSDDAMKALADRLEEHVLLMANTGTDLSMKNWNTVSNDILLAARTLRAALTPPADDEISAIRARHEAARDEPETWTESHAWAHLDRATLLRAVDRLSAELAKERERRVEGWQPMETAPRDGQDILVYCQDTNEMFVGFSNPAEIAADPSIFFYALRTDGARIGCRPHLWRPLPAPPAAQHEDTP